MLCVIGFKNFVFKCITMFMQLDVDIATHIHIKEDGPKRRSAIQIFYNINGFQHIIHNYPLFLSHITNILGHFKLRMTFFM